MMALNGSEDGELRLAGHTLTIFPMATAVAVLAFGGTTAAGAFSNSTWHLELA
jgi:hypothetical protein